MARERQKSAGSLSGVAESDKELFVSLAPCLSAIGRASLPFRLSSRQRSERGGTVRRDQRRSVPLRGVSEARICRAGVAVFSASPVRQFRAGALYARSFVPSVPLVPS